VQQRLQKDEQAFTNLLLSDREQVVIRFQADTSANRPTRVCGLQAAGAHKLCTWSAMHMQTVNCTSLRLVMPCGGMKKGEASDSRGSRAGPCAVSLAPSCGRSMWESTAALLQGGGAAT
jgi:hypothetical protein